MPFESPNYTNTPNDLLGHVGQEIAPGLMAEMGIAELKVTLAICRLTFGFHRRKAKASLTTLMQMTGLSRQGVLDGTTAAESRGLIRRCSVSRGRRAEWEAVVSDEAKDAYPNGQTSQASRPVTDTQLVKPVDQTSQASGPVEGQLVKPVDQTSQASRPNKEKERKQTQKRKETNGSADADRAPEPEKPETLVAEKEKPLHRQMFEALAAACAWEIELLTEAQRGQLNQTEKMLRTMRGQTIAPADVMAFGDWWKSHDWRGKQGEHPRPDQVRAEWGRFRYWEREQARRLQDVRRKWTEPCPPAEPVDPELAEAQRTWRETLAALQGQMTAATFTWLADTEAVGRDNGRLIVACPTEAAREWIENRLAGTVQRALEVVAPGLAVEYIMGMGDDRKNSNHVSGVP
jgi:hypothetical protein